MLFASDAPDLVWRAATPPPRPFLRAVFDFVTRAPPPLPTDARAAIRHYGLPSIPGTTPEEELTGLLKHAAVIEHGLFVQYLYAAFSARDRAIAEVLARIAVEEMGHLLTVLNLLSACGAPPVLSRYDWEPNFILAPFPFRLEALSARTLAKYAMGEMPDRAEVDPDEGDVIDELIKLARPDMGAAPARVGLLYTKIYWLLRPSDGAWTGQYPEPWADYPIAEVLDEVGPERHVAAFPLAGDLGRQGAPSHWDRYVDSIILREARDRPAGLEAVASVTAQGEGFAQTPDGHFDRFVALYRKTKEAASVSYPVAEDPWVAGAAASGAPGSEIVSSLAAALARIGDGLYELSLLCTALYFQLDPATQDAARFQLARATLDLMKPGLREAGSQLPAMPSGASGAPDTVAGLCFSRPATDTPADYGPLLIRARVVADDLRAACQALATDPAARPGLKGVARTIRDKAVAPMIVQLAALPAPDV